MPGGLEQVVDHDPTAVVHRESGLAEQVRGAEAGGPDGEVGGEVLAVERHRVRADPEHPAVLVHRDPARPQGPTQVVAPAGREAVAQGTGGHERDLERRPALGELRRGLHPGEATAHDRHPPHRAGVEARGDRRRARQPGHRQRVFRGARDAVEIGSAAHREHEVVVVDQPVLDLDGPRRRVHRRDSAPHQPHPGGGEQRPQRAVA